MSDKTFMVNPKTLAKFLRKSIDLRTAMGLRFKEEYESTAGFNDFAEKGLIPFLENYNEPRYMILESDLKGYLKFILYSLTQEWFEYMHGQARDVFHIIDIQKARCAVVFAFLELAKEAGWEHHALEYIKTQAEGLDKGLDGLWH